MALTVDTITRIKLSEKNKTSIFLLLENILTKKIELNEEGEKRINSYLNDLNKIPIPKSIKKTLIQKIKHKACFRRYFERKIKNDKIRLEKINELNREEKLLLSTVQEPQTTEIFKKMDSYIRERVYSGEKITKDLKQKSNNILLLENLNILCNPTKYENEILSALINIRELLISYKCECINKGDNSIIDSPLFENFNIELQDLVKKNNSYLYRKKLFN